MMKKLAIPMMLALFSCGGSDSVGTVVSRVRPGPRTVKVHPEVTRVAPNAQALFSVTPASTSVVWSVRESGGGTITQAGVYTAPSTVGTYHVVASAEGVYGEATVNVAAPIRVSTPSSVATPACVTLVLEATVSGATDTAVVWAPIDSACGTLTPEGHFKSTRVTGTCTATVSARADPMATATTTITITPERVLSVAVTPITVALAPGGSTPFAAAVTTSCGTFPAGQ